MNKKNQDSDPAPRSAARLWRRLGFLTTTALLLVGIGVAPAVAAGDAPPPNMVWVDQPLAWNGAQYGLGVLYNNNPDTTTKSAYPYYFFGKVGNQYQPAWVAMCIDFQHDYDTTGNGTADLEKYVQKPYAQQINQTLAAALQLAEQNQLNIDKTGVNQPLQFNSQTAVDFMFSAQWRAWYLFAKYSKTNPVSSLKMTDFYTDPDPTKSFDPTPYLKQIDDLIGEYNTPPAFNGKVVTLSDQAYTTPVDSNLSPFGLAVDQDNSTPNYDNYITVSVVNGRVVVQRKAAFSGTLTVAFKKVFNTGIDDGMNLYAAINTPANSQTKSLLTNAYPSSFSISFQSQTFSPVGSTSVSDQVVSAGDLISDVLTPAVSGGGAWPSLPNGGGGVSVTYGVDLYGPFASQPKQSDPIPASPTAHKTLTVSGTDPVPVSFTVPQAGYYTFVVGVDRSAQSTETQLYLPDPYSWRDAFGLKAESFLSPFTVNAKSQVTSSAVSAGGVAEDSLTLSHTGTWVNGSDGNPVPVTATGTAYWVAGSSAPTPEAAGVVPAGARVLGTAQLVFTQDATQTARVTTPSGESGYVVWVWSIAKTDYFNAWSDVFGNPTEYTHSTVPLIPQLAKTGVLVPVGLVGASVALVLLGLAVLMLRRRSRGEGPRHLNPAPERARHR